ncbi:conserved hypothetical protein [Carnobacterium maltaromaticum]|uniref:hypothetical protein n=1 Tax=Carnobacterium maltaromaticum TaxID=2751 RepID=UPI000704F320|nr:hypothetical protein [Carnobacterium maltaromaticum]KRN70683.1 hypothetical protein IV76_GL001602 [Carnobacterium maltaromaticum]CRH18753.1 conserved hypothetical protein [Carnobacterium maltaromaticum]
MTEASESESIVVYEWQRYLVERAGITAEEAGAAMNRLMQGMSIANDRTETFRELTSVDERKTGSKRNGTLDRREAFGNMLKHNKKGW